MGALPQNEQHKRVLQLVAFIRVIRLVIIILAMMISTKKGNNGTNRYLKELNRAIYAVSLVRTIQKFLITKRLFLEWRLA